MTQSTTRRADMTPAEKRDLEHRLYWESSIFTVDSSSASVIDGLSVPVVGGLLDIALDQSIESVIAMLQHPDPDLRWTDDTALVVDGRIVVVVRHTSRGPDVIRFDSRTSLPAEQAKPGRRASRRSTITWIDVALSYRGRFLAVIRFTPSGAVVTRFDLPDASSGSLADPPDGPDVPKFSVSQGGRDRTHRSGRRTATTSSSCGAMQ